MEHAQRARPALCVVFGLLYGVPAGLLGLVGVYLVLIAMVVAASFGRV